MGWSQAICDYCWEERNGERKPVRMRDPENEECCYCGTATLSGIYIRVDPATVPHPS